MNKLDKRSLGFLCVVFIAVLARSFLIHDYVIGMLFFVCTALSLSLTYSPELYDKLYCTLLVSAAFEYTAYLPGHEQIYFFHVMLFIMIIFTALQWIKNGGINVNMDKKILVFFVIWFIYICAGYFWSKNKSFNIKYIAIYAMMFAFLAVIVIYNNTKEKFKNTIKIIGLMAAVIVVIGIIETAVGVELPVKHYYNYTVHKLSEMEIELLKTRPMVFSYNPNNLATLLSLCLPIPVFLFTFGRYSKQKIVYLLCSLLIFAAIALTTSRVSLLSVILMVAIFTIAMLKEYKLKGLIYPLIIVIGFGVVYKFSYVFVMRNSDMYRNQMKQKMNKLTNIENVKVGEEGSEGERLTVVYDVVEGVFHDKKLLGFGAGNTTQQLMDKGNTHGIYSPHGLAIEVLGDFGVFFFILYGIYYLYLLYRLLLISNMRDYEAKISAYTLIAALFGFALSSFGPSSVTYFFPYWMMYGVTISCINLYSRQ
ncbi:hypothetical protein HBE96_00105 [Clostridium sp. P21]|uniref:O-antigen ligase-related domain-containing protein n=1 Tax=Clostridium muellerianum TaxID=2716538 RepID=A0A7Y0HN16_9CLOT|nr:O-antigen ligase family protein [Clostridium muellerianum]NMM61128.1 hypothetical protein [Clostridium muellerianum]